MEKKGSENYDILLRTRKLAFSILSFCQSDDGKKVGYNIRDQLSRSGTSIGANLHEAKGSGSDKEFCRYYSIALRSCHETLYWVDLIKDLYKLDQILKLRDELIEIIKIVSTIVIKLKAKQKDENLPDGK